MVQCNQRENSRIISSSTRTRGPNNVGEVEEKLQKMICKRKRKGADEGREQQDGEERGEGGNADARLRFSSMRDWVTSEYGRKPGVILSGSRNVQQARVEAW